MQRQEVISIDLSSDSLFVKVNDPGWVYSGLKEAASEIGYPEIANTSILSFRSNRLKKQQLVKILMRCYVKIVKPRDIPVYLIEAEDGEKFLIGEKGLDFDNI